jgi:hypothetical protein
MTVAELDSSSSGAFILSPIDENESEGEGEGGSAAAL